MFCLGFKRKLYDFIEGSLKDKNIKRVKAHLEKCSSCRYEYQQIKLLLDRVSEKEIPKMDDRFWAEFKTRLDERLLQENQETPAMRFGRCRIELRQRLGWIRDSFSGLLRPVFGFRPVYAIIVMLILAGITSYIFQMPPLDFSLSKADREILDTLIYLEEVDDQSSVFTLLTDETLFLEEEIELISQLDPAFTL